MGTLKYTTVVPVGTTVGEIQAMLVGHGADAIGVRYENRQPVGLAFTLDTVNGPQSFNLPVDIAAVLRLLAAQHADGRITTRHVRKHVLLSREHAARVAWRVLKDWLAAQLAMIEAEMATLDQIMLPYMVTGPNGVTLYDEFRARQLTTGHADQESR